MTKAVAVLAGTEGRHHGNVFFTAEADGSTKVTVDLHDLTHGLHGFHIHALGDTTNGCMSTGIHFNPSAKEHGGREGENRHAGDLGNIDVGEGGTASFEFTAFQIPLSGPNSILGRAVVVHEDRDDLGKGGNSQSKIDGNSGARVACGVIALQA